MPRVTVDKVRQLDERYPYDLSLWIDRSEPNGRGTVGPG